MTPVNQEVRVGWWFAWRKGDAKTWVSPTTGKPKQYGDLEEIDVTLGDGALPLTSASPERELEAAKADAKRKLLGILDDQLANEAA